MQPDRSFWKGRRVLVTGHTGFKGSWLALWLAHLGAEVHGLALPPEGTPSLFEALGLEGRLAGHRLTDIRDRAALEHAVRAIDPEIVFHLAAQPLVRRAHREPVETFATNVMGTANLLEALRAVPDLRAVIAVTTDKVYRDNAGARPYTEADALGGVEPYGASKAASEMVIDAYRDSYLAPRGVGLMAARAGNVVGGGDRAEDRLIPDFVRAAEAGRALVIRNPEAVRPWQHVLEPLSGYIRAAERLAADPESFSVGLNFGPCAEDFRTVREVADACVALWGGGASWRVEPDAAIHEAAHLTLDSTRAAELLGWRPRWGINACIRHTLEWYRRVGAGADAATLSLRQIADFTGGEAP